MNFDAYHRANVCIAHGALTNSKRLSAFVKGVSPSHAKRGAGPFIWDSENKRYLDFICALGSNLLGYSNPYIISTIKSHLEDGLTLSLSSTIEIVAAEKLKEAQPFVDKVRFLKTGTEACMASLRIARSHTGRKKILQEGYNGWSDELITTVSIGNGVNESSQVQKLTSLDQITEDIACVIMEPIITKYDQDRINDLKNIRAKCSKTGTILIFDETITGFRWPNFSFSRDSGITPDILLLGKCIGGGLPLSAICLVKKDLDKTDWFVSSTFAGETLALHAFVEVVRLLTSQVSVKDLWAKGADMMKRFNLIYPEKISIEGYGTRGAFKGDDLTIALFMQECHKAGILIGASFFLNFANIDYKEPTLSTFQDILIRIKMGQVKLEGEMPKKPVSMKARE